MTEPDVSVVIVTWNGRRFMDGCLQAVVDQRGVRTETLLVDNASTDGTVEYVRSRYPHVRLIPLAENRGFAEASNIGARQARAPLVAFLNNDTIAGAGWLQALMSGLDPARGFALTTSRIVYMDDPRVIDSAGDGVLRSGGAFKRYHGRDASEAAESMEVFGACGAACLMPKNVFEELGGFDEQFFASHEDVDLSYRARLRGYRVMYVADAVVRHHGSATLGRVSSRAVYYGQRNLEWVYLKNSPASVLLRTFPSHVVYNIAAAAYFIRAGQGAAFVRGKAAAVAGMPAMLRARAAIQRSRRVGAAAIWPLLEPGWFRMKMREKRFDLGAAGARQ